MKDICIVEDEMAVLDLIVELLSYTYNVKKFNDPVKALGWLKENSDSIDLLILDINMATLTGIDLGEEIKQLYPDLKILYISGYVSQGHEKMKDKFFLYKPFTFSELIDKIEQVMND